MKFGGFIREELSAYKAHVTLSAKHLSQEHTGFASINKLHSDFCYSIRIDMSPLIDTLCSDLYDEWNSAKYFYSTDTK